MPLSSETIRNKPLSGPELIEIILKGTRELLARDGMFATHVGYGRVAFRVRVELEMDNLTYPHHSAQGTSSPANTEEAAQTFPLPEPAEDSVALDLERSQQITSPNATRILNDLPVQVQAVEGGRLVTHDLVYSKEDVPEQPAPTDLDRSQEATSKIQGRSHHKKPKEG